MYRLIPQQSLFYHSEPTKSHFPILKAPTYTSLLWETLVYPTPRQCSTPTSLAAVLSIVGRAGMFEYPTSGTVFKIDAIRLKGCLQHEPTNEHCWLYCAATTYPR